MSVRVKICGITSLEDARAAVDAGADALGFVFAESPRRIAPAAAREIIRQLPPFTTTVGVFVNCPAAEMVRVKNMAGLDILQLHGDEPPEILRQLPGRIIRSIAMGKSGGQAPEQFPDAMILLDTFVPGASGGTGKTFDWSLAEKVTQPFILAGGLTPENISEAIYRTRPYAVDVSSGVERAPGVKDHGKLVKFIRNVRGCAV